MVIPTSGLTVTQSTTWCYLVRGWCYHVDASVNGFNLVVEASVNTSCTWVSGILFELSELRGLSLA